jgi:2-polyprenyl-3-methyl-5-hydroxy-6-metoxy-1,4-benzoquinol methylase
MAANRIDPVSENQKMTDASSQPTQMKWDGETIGRFWRWQATHPEQYFTNQFGNRIAAALAPLLAGCKSVVDYGCGPGFLVPHLIGQGFEVSATDQSPEALEAVAARCAGMPGFGRALPTDRLIAEGARFDGAIAIEVIEHLDDTHLEIFFDNLRALVNPGGLAIITTPNDEQLANSDVYCPHCDHAFHRYQHMRSWSAASLAASITQHGFNVQRSFTTDFSEPRFGDIKGKAKRIVKYLLGRPEKRPHLVCIARLPG